MNWNASKEEIEAIKRIVNRLEGGLECPVQDKANIEMDITAVHLNGTPLDLEKLESFDFPDLMHDVSGIVINLDRETGRLQNCFVPRCAMK